MRSARLWAQLLGLVKAVVEGVEFDAWRNRHAVAHPLLREVVAKAETIRVRRLPGAALLGAHGPAKRGTCGPTCADRGEVIIDGPSGSADVVARSVKDDRMRQQQSVWTRHRRFTPAPPNRGPERQRVQRWLRLVVIFGVFLTPTTATRAAWAHGAGETTMGYVLVQQALGHLAHDSSHVGVEAAMEKVDDALATKDQAGVDVAEVRMAKTALQADQVAAARALLQHSITAATSQLVPAVGEETGTAVVGLPLPGRGTLAAADWALGSLSLVMMLAGIGLAVWFRPVDNLRRLRRLTSPGGPLHSHAER